MTAQLDERAGHRLWLVAAEGPALGTYQDALDLIGDALGHDAEVVVVPVARLHPEFWQLRTGMAGEFIQKLINYRLRFAVLGDLSAETAQSDALRDFVRESNRGRHVSFVADLDALVTQLGPAA
ncbi:hypothetical protein D3C72_918350 [compost metagenome]